MGQYFGLIDDMEFVIFYKSNFIYVPTPEFIKDFGTTFQSAINEVMKNCKFIVIKKTFFL